MNARVHGKYVNTGSMHLASISSGTVEYFYVDHLSSTRLKTDGNGDSIYDTNYVPFGPAHGESGSEEFKYTGKRENLSGLYYYGVRYYDPQVGEFVVETSGGYRDQGEYHQRSSLIASAMLQTSTIPSSLTGSKWWSLVMSMASVWRQVAAWTMSARSSVSM